MWQSIVQGENTRGGGVKRHKVYPRIFRVKKRNRTSVSDILNEEKK